MLSESGNATDEAVPVLVMVSDWLQLDSTDVWVRYDSEIVSPVKIHVLPALRSLWSDLRMFYTRAY